MGLDLIAKVAVLSDKTPDFHTAVVWGCKGAKTLGTMSVGPVEVAPWHHHCHPHPCSGVLLWVREVPCHIDWCSESLFEAYRESLKSISSF